MGRYLLDADGYMQYAWIVWGRIDGASKPLGCYGTRDAALEAEALFKAHENIVFWQDIWITPWPLSLEPVLNFRFLAHKGRVRTVANPPDAE